MKKVNRALPNEEQPKSFEYSLAVSSGQCVDIGPLMEASPNANVVETACRTRVCLVYPFDPMGRKIGGIQTFLRGFIRHSPPGFKIQLVGTTTDTERHPVGATRAIEVMGRRIEHLAVLHEKQENVKAIIPLSLRFVLGVLRFGAQDWSRDSVLLFNRIEPSMVFPLSIGPRIGFVHNDIGHQLAKGSEMSWRFLPRVYKSLERKLVNRFDRVYVVNGNTFKLYSSIYPRLSDRLSFLPTWVDEELFRPPTSAASLLRSKLNLQAPLPPMDSRWVLFVGRLQHQKDPFLLIETFAALQKKVPDSCLLIVGDGNLRGQIEQRAKDLGLWSNVFMLGFLDQEVLAQLYQCSDVLLLTSRFEGMPRSVVEAIGSGLPVVTTQVGEVGRVVTEGITGHIVEARHPEVIADAVADVFSGGAVGSTACYMRAVISYRPASVLQPLYDICENLYWQLRVVGKSN